jgi:DNA repair protein RadC
LKKNVVNNLGKKRTNPNKFIMKGISNLKHQKLLAIALEIQGDVKHVIDSEVLRKLRGEFTNLNELYSQYRELLQQLEGLVRDYESKERAIRSKILSRSLRKLAKNGQTGADLRMVITSLNSCAH